MKVIICVGVGLSILFAFSTIALAQEKCEHDHGEESKASEAESKVTLRVKEGTKQTAERNPMVVFETNYGDIKIELFKKAAPISVANFLSYVKEGFYDNTIFHRVVNGFVLQAGGFTKDMTAKTPKDPIKNEAKNGLSNKRGTISMARTGEIDSGSSHFFVNLVDNTRLDHTGEEPAKYGYAVFGKVAEGMDVVDKIAKVQVTKKGAYQNVPSKPVLINKAVIVKQVEAQPETKKAVEEKAPDKQVLEKKIEKIEKVDEEKPKDE